MRAIEAVFFDLGETLGTATLAGRPPRLATFDVFPFVPEVLSNLRARGLRLGVISNTGDEKKAPVEAVLRPTGLLDDFDAQLLVYSADEGVTKQSPEIFARAAARAGVAPGPDVCLFVGEDTAERAVAAGAGWQVCPHPLLVAEVLDGQRLRYLRVTLPASKASTSWRDELRRHALVPQYITGLEGTVVYVLASQRTALALVNLQFGVEFLGEPDLPRLTDLYLLRDDLARRSGFGSEAGDAARAFARPGADRFLVSATADGVLAALPPDSGPDDFHFASARHGHHLKLTPDPLLWDVAPPAVRRAAAALAEPPTVPAAVVEEIRRIGPATVLDAVERYSGLRSLDGSASGIRIESRHIQNRDEGNARAVEQAVGDLERRGNGRFRIRLQRFTFAGRTLHNVEAELPGMSSEIVLVSGHLDSTAGSEPDFDGATGRAPGADDDGSGVAAVLAIAERLARLPAAHTPARTVRFVLFNAEEQGLVGSRAYARRSKARGETIVAVWQMDMIGHNTTPPLTWEIHTGFAASPAVEGASRRLAELLARVAPAVASELPAPQIYDGQTEPDGDPAAGRSDHASFQEQGYPACVASEDLFVDGPGAPAPDGNPNYHRRADTVIDAAYASAIARAVAAAAWLSASM